MGLILVIILVLLLVGGIAPWGGYAGPGHFYGGGPYLGGGFGLILVILVVLLGWSLAAWLVGRLMGF